MATSRNCSMSGLNSGHHYLTTYQIVMISDNVEFLRYCDGHFENDDQLEIVQCRDSIREIIYPHGDIVTAILKMRPVEIFQCQESIRDIIIYPHMKWH